MRKPRLSNVEMLARLDAALDEKPVATVATIQALDTLLAATRRIWR